MKNTLKKAWAWTKTRDSYFTCGGFNTAASFTMLSLGDFFFGVLLAVMAALVFYMGSKKAPNDQA